jgi:hypothetical protein
MHNNKVYEWRVFVSFIKQKFELGPNVNSHPVLDAAALDLHTGDLQRRDKLEKPGTDHV